MDLEETQKEISFERIDLTRLSREEQFRLILKRIDLILENLKEFQVS